MYHGRKSRLMPAALGLLTACMAPPPPAPAPVVPEPVAAPAAIDFPHPRVWTAAAEVTIRGDSVATSVPRPFTALEVVAADADGITVRCESCTGEPEGRVSHEDVVHTPLPLHEAAWGTLPEFALALRDAAARGDTAALSRVMSPEFTFSFVGLQGVPQALATWASEELATLSLVPRLLDRGLAPGSGGVWAAPPEHFETLGYDGLRLGVRRSADGSWEWIFLIAGEAG